MPLRQQLWQFVMRGLLMIIYANLSKQLLHYCRSQEQLHFTWWLTITIFFFFF